MSKKICISVILLITLCFTLCIAQDHAPLNFEFDFQSFTLKLEKLNGYQYVIGVYCGYENKTRIYLLDSYRNTKITEASGDVLSEAIERIKKDLL